MEIAWFCFSSFMIFMCLHCVRLYKKHTRPVKCYCKVNMRGKTVLITGGSRGIGLETAIALAAMGAKVLIASSNQYTGQAAVSIIKEKSQNNNVVYYHLNLEDFSSVQRTAESLLNNEERLDVLINNAGISYHAKAKAKNGCDRIFASNYLGHFLLTYMLVVLLKRSAPSRIVNVTSAGHKYGGNKLNFTIHEDKYGSEIFPHLCGYDTSKLALVLFTKELARRLSEGGVTTVAVHPGFAINTRIWTDMKLFYSPVISWLSTLILWPINQGVLSCAQSVVHAAVAPKLTGLSGKYLERCDIVAASQWAQDDRAAKLLWNVSMLLTGCTYNGGVVSELTIENEHENQFDSVGAYEHIYKVHSGKKQPLKEPEDNRIARSSEASKQPSLWETLNKPKSKSILPI